MFSPSTGFNACVLQNCDFGPPARFALCRVGCRDLTPSVQCAVCSVQGFDRQGLKYFPRFHRRLLSARSDAAIGPIRRFNATTLILRTVPVYA